jgi:hypothetical protein
MTSTTIPMVHRIEIFSTNPAMSKMIPSTIMAASLSVSRTRRTTPMVANLATLVPVDHPIEG